jgi:hypothetical protein
MVHPQADVTIPAGEHLENTANFGAMHVGINWRSLPRLEHEANAFFNISGLLPSKIPSDSLEVPDGIDRPHNAAGWIGGARDSSFLPGGDHQEQESSAEADARLFLIVFLMAALVMVFQASSLIPRTTSTATLASPLF